MCGSDEARTLLSDPHVHACILDPTRQQRREKDEQRLLELRANVAKLDKALTAEIKRGLERNRALQSVRGMRVLLDAVYSAQHLLINPRPDSGSFGFFLFVSPSYVCVSSGPRSSWTGCRPRWRGGWRSAPRRRRTGWTCSRAGWTRWRRWVVGRVPFMQDLFWRRVEWLGRYVMCASMCLYVSYRTPTYQSIYLYQRPQ